MQLRLSTSKMHPARNWRRFGLKHAFRACTRVRAWLPGDARGYLASAIPHRALRLLDDSFSLQGDQPDLSMPA